LYTGIFYRKNKKTLWYLDTSKYEGSFEDIEAGTMGFIRSSERYRIPKPTLKFHLHGKVLRQDSKNRLYDRLPTLLPEVEKEIAAYIAKLKSCFLA
jgi:hypothetical protein